MKQVACKVLCILAMALVATGAGATRMTTLEVADMAVEADAIAIGRCVESHSQRIGRTLMTLIKIEVEESLKGAGPQELTVVVPGGIDVERPVPVAATVPGAPMILQDEDVLLFLAHSQAVEGGYRVVGFSQGKYSVVEDGSGDRMVAQGRYSGSNGKPLEEMKAEIQEALAGN